MEGCGNMRSDENEYCKLHKLQVFVDMVISKGKRVCTGYLRGCREELDETYKKKKCPLCLEKDREKEQKLKERKLETLSEEDEHGNKLCSTCFSYKKPEEYIGEKSLPVKQCLSCRAQNKRADGNRNREHRNQKALENSKRTENRFKQYVKDAREQKKAFEITFEHFCTLTLLPCRYCGVIQEEGYNGLDRIISHLGFTVENTAPCCHMCNKMKHILSEEVFFKTLEHILTFSGKLSGGNLFPEVFRNSSSTVYSMVLKRAENKGLPCDILLADYDSIVISPCYLCGKEISEHHKNGIDRVDNSLGYLLSNVKPCCTHCNYIKGVLSLDSMFSKMKQIYWFQVSQNSN